MIQTRFGFLSSLIAVVALIGAWPAAAAVPRAEPAYHQTWPPGVEFAVQVPAVAPYNREARVSPASIGADQPDPAGATALRQTHAGRYALAHRAVRDRWRHRLE